MERANETAAPPAAEAEHEPEQKPQAVGGLSDTVFGLAITLLATSLAITTKSSLGEILQQLGGFAAAFFLIALIWLRRHRLLRWMRHEPLGFTRLNFVLLFLVISYTYILRLLALSTTRQAVFTVFALFAILTALVNSTLALLYHYALRSGVVMGRYHQQAKDTRTDLLVISAGFLVATPFLFIEWRIFIAVFFVAFLLRFVWRRIRRRTQRRHAQEKASAASQAPQA